MPLEKSKTYFYMHFNPLVDWISDLDPDSKVNLCVLCDTWFNNTIKDPKLMCKKCFMKNETRLPFWSVVKLKEENPVSSLRGSFGLPIEFFYTQLDTLVGTKLLTKVETVTESISNEYINGLWVPSYTLDCRLFDGGFSLVCSLLNYSFSISNPDLLPESKLFIIEDNLKKLSESMKRNSPLL